jgi:uncharacterized coiled-coil protein SlyX
LQTKKAADSLQAARNEELEVLVKSQADKIAELEAAYADLKSEKEKYNTWLSRLLDKHKTFTVKLNKRSKLMQQR